MHTGSNKKLKALIVGRFGSQAEAAQRFNMPEIRLSRIIHARVVVRPEEKRVIAWKLQCRIAEIFPE